MPTLISGYLERISSKVFDDYHRDITELIGNQHGVYALYKKDRLYYVGLATNLRMRVKHHLKDRHAKKWDSFSLYLIRSADHLKELESLVIRIAEPKGNISRGRFASSPNLLRDLRQAMEHRNRERIQKILSSTQRKRRTAIKRKSGRLRPASTMRSKRTPSLQGLLPENTQLRAVYKKQEYTAIVDAAGRIILNGQTYNSPSSAGSAISGKPIDGWHFWKYQKEVGAWVKIDELRKKV